MARIPQHEIDRLKHAVSVVRLAEAKGIKLRPHGSGNVIGLCPWHDDHDPSLVLTPGKNLWNCLGACGQGGSVIDWVMKDQGVSFRHAVEILQSDPAAAASAAPSVKTSTVRRLPPPVTLDASDQEALEQVVGFYHQTFLKYPEAAGYLESRGLAPAGPLAEAFQLGFANRTLGYRLPFKNRKEGAEIRGKLERLGVLRASGHEHLTGCVVVPIIDIEGRIVQLYGRRISKANPGSGTHLYLPGPNRGVFNVVRLKGEDDVILCEAVIDALTFHQAGFHNVTATAGVNGFTDEHLAAFKRYGTKRVLIAFDRDDAGAAAAAKLADRLTTEGIECYRVLFPHGQDANEYAQKVTPAEKSLAIAIRSATWMGRGKPPSQATVLPSAPAAKKEEAPAAKEEEMGEVEEPPSDPEHSPPPPPSPAPEPPHPSFLAARPAPAAPAVSSAPVSPAPRVEPDVPVEIDDGVIKMTLGDRVYRVIGLTNNLAVGQMRVNVMARRGPAMHADVLDLYAARFRSAFIKQAAEELEVDEKVIKHDLGRVLLKLEELQEAAIRKESAPKDAPPPMTEGDRREALALLKDPRLIERILRDLERMGVVGEETNKLVALLAATSRKDERPLAIIIQSSSAAGKTLLMDAVLSLIPEEERVRYSALTGQALFYLGEKELRHKILAISEEEGASRASYALKLLQSEGKLSIASTGKDPATGKLVANEYLVEGPVMIFMTTTAVEIDEELQNRCIVLTVDEDREQTRAIHRMQREQETIEGLFGQRRKEGLIKLHQNAQRLLEPVVVRNPYARELTFLDTKTRTRRDHMKYLSLIRAVALLHQHQRPRKMATDPETGDRHEYIEVEPADIAIANRLAHQVLGRSLAELAATTERLLFLLEDLVTDGCERLRVRRQDYRFTRRQVLDATGWSYTLVRRHLDRLIELEYVLVHRGGRGQSFEYELLYDGQGKDRQPFVVGLIDVEALGDASTTPTLHTSEAGLHTGEGGFAHPLHPHRTPFAQGSHTPGNGSNGTSPKASSDSASDLAENAHLETSSEPAPHSYSQAAPAAPPEQPTPASSLPLSRPSDPTRS